MKEVPPQIKGLVFDCDGTLADTMPLHYEAWVAALGEYGHSFSEALFYEMAGVTTERIIEILNDRHGYKVPVKEGARRKDELFEQRLHKLEPIEPVVALVHKYAGKLPMAVATGGTRVLCARTLEVLGIRRHFEVMVTADDVERGKPAPDIFLKAARLMGVRPQDCCAFEDGDLGIQAARSAGMMTVDIRPMRV